jgi:molecular chaperone GrpE
MTGNGPRNTEVQQSRRLLDERTADLQRVKAEYDNTASASGRTAWPYARSPWPMCSGCCCPSWTLSVGRACANEPRRAR